MKNMKMNQLNKEVNGSTKTVLNSKPVIINPIFGKKACIK
jgi:hypothetical protein